jgi:hypothetical protein
MIHSSAVHKTATRLDEKLHWAYNIKMKHANVLPPPRVPEMLTVAQLVKNYFLFMGPRHHNCF